MAERDVLHGIDLDAMGFVPLDLACVYRHDGHVAEEIHERGKAHPDSFGRARLLPVLNVFTPANELARSRREVPWGFSFTALFSQLPLGLLVALGAFPVVFGGQ